MTDTALANRIATLEGEIKALGERIAVLGRRNDEIASVAGKAQRLPASSAAAVAAAVAELRKALAAAAAAVQRGDLDALANRVAALERISKAIEAELAAGALRRTRPSLVHGRRPRRAAAAVERGGRS